MLTTQARIRLCTDRQMVSKIQEMWLLMILKISLYNIFVWGVMCHSIIYLQLNKSIKIIYLDSFHD